MSFEPQPAHAWQFENSNVDSVSGLSPSFSTITSGTTIAPSYTGGKYGQCVYLNNSAIISTSASNAYIIYTIPSPTYSLNNFSVAAWVYPYTINIAFTNSFLVATPAGQPFYSQFQLTTSGSKSAVTIFNAGSPYSLNSLDNLPVGQWNHHCVTFAGIAGTTNVFATYYINGVLQSTNTVIQTTYGPLYIDKLVVGSDSSSTGASANAAMDDLRLYRQTLTATQVLALYTKQGIPVPTDIPRLAWQFENSNVESIQGLVPSSQVSPGPGQLLGSAAIVTNTPVIDTALLLPRFTDSYMNLGTSSPVNVDVTTSNLFVEAWVYPVSSINVPIISAGTGTTNNWTLSVLSGTPGLYANCYPGASAGGNFSNTALVGGWVHLAFSWALGPTSNTLTGFVNGIRSFQQVITRGIVYTPGIQSIIGDPLSAGNTYVRDIRVIRGGITPTNSFTLVPMQLQQFTYILPTYVTGTGGSTVFTLLGQFITYPPGKFGQCVYLNNGMTTSTSTSNAWIEYSSLSSYKFTLNNFSIAAWVYPYSVNTSFTNTFFNMTPSVSTATQFQLSSAASGKSTVSILTNGSLVAGLDSISTLSIGKWAHHCLTFSNVGATTLGNVFASYYINGTLQAGSNAATQATGLLTKLTMGSSTVSTGASANAALDDFRVYDRALTSSEAASVYLALGDPAGPKTYAIGTSSNVSVDSDGYTIHTFTSPGTFVCARPGVADVLVVAGGGGGAGGNGSSFCGGGGGAGGVIYSPNFNIRTAGVYNVTVGNGGPGTTTAGTNGDPSQFMELVAIGGGGGGINGPGNNGKVGGSGGGAGRSSYAGTYGIYNQGNGGATSGNNSAGGGGGRKWVGMGGLGGIGGKGGDGIVFNNNIYGGGGGGACSSPTSIIYGGAGGGGPAGIYTFPGVPGTANTGGGGGGAGSFDAASARSGGNGGSGIVIIKMFTQTSTTGYETVYTGETTIGTFAGYSQTANVQVFVGASAGGSIPYTWVKPSRGTFARIECIGGGGNGTSSVLSATSIIYIFMQSNGTLVNTNTLTDAQMLALGITYSGTITAHTVTVATNPNIVTITTTGSSLALIKLVPQSVGTVINTVQGTSGTISGQYGRGAGGGGGGYAFATLPLTELPSTVNVSVGGPQTPSVFGPLTTPYIGPGNVTGTGGGFAYNTAAGAGGGSPIASVAGIFVGGAGSAQTITSIAPGSYAGYGGGGGGNGIVPGAPSMFTGKGGDGSPQTFGTYAQQGEYPGGGGGGSLSTPAFSTSGSGANGAAGQVRIIVY